MWSFAKSMLKSLPIIGPALTRAAVEQRSVNQPSRSVEEIFTEIYRANHWGGRESVSGPGSDLVSTVPILYALPGLFSKYRIGSILDIPCGDFNWLCRAELWTMQYTGADIVRELIEKNQRFAKDGMAFRRLDLLTDQLPRADLVICRDCLVHFSFDDAQRALANIVASGCTYLLTTTFPNHKRNDPINTGEWRPLNLQAAPFNLGPPLELIMEKCPEPRFADKSLALWRIEDFQSRKR